MKNVISNEANLCLTRTFTATDYLQMPSPPGNLCQMLSICTLAASSWACSLDWHWVLPSVSWYWYLSDTIYITERFCLVTFSHIECHDVQCIKRKCFMQRTRVLKMLTVLRSIFNKSYVKRAVSIKTTNFLKSKSVRPSYLIKCLKQGFLLSRTGFTLQLNKDGHKDQPYISE